MDRARTRSWYRHHRQTALWFFSFASGVNFSIFENSRPCALLLMSGLSLTIKAQSRPVFQGRSLEVGVSKLKYYTALNHAMSSSGTWSHFSHKEMKNLSCAPHIIGKTYVPNKRYSTTDIGKPTRKRMHGRLIPLHWKQNEVRSIISLYTAYTQHT